ncbi:MAG: hypothetical protein GY705_22480 [Bacteroidetes bacterium]|nr:hypothetical protein [Bacteroidota bacterium]
MIFILFIGFLLAACEDTHTSSQEENTITPDSLTFKIPYNTENPQKVLSLPGKLREISGLSMNTSGKRLAAIQDEDGLIFFLDRDSGAIQQKIKFWKDGDYEGIEIVDSTIYIVKSSGTLYEVQKAGKEKQKVEKYNDDALSPAHDVEGLAYDKKNNRLLIACKAKAGDGEEYKFKKAVYSFDLTTKEISERPSYVISLEDVHYYLNTSPAIRSFEKLIEFFAPDESEFAFSPSGIAIHPLSGNIYIISSVGKLILILSPEGKILHLEKLKKKMHNQPEGICFASDGTLYIANEGRGKGGKILEYVYLP